MIVTLVVLLLVAFLLILDRWRASTVFSVGVLILLVSGELTAHQVLHAFANPSIISIFLLVIITAIINEYYDIIGILDKLFSNTSSLKGFLLKMGFSVGSLSAIMNNTPIVAMMIPFTYQWGKKRNIAPSRLLIPLSYTTILGGMITVIGTSTNLVINGFIESSGNQVLGFQDFLIPGLLVMFTGVLFISLIGYKWLPKNHDIIQEATDKVKEYLVETEVAENSYLIGKTVKEAELRNLDGIFLIEIQRQGRVITPVSPDRIIQKRDRLFFAGETEKVINLIQDKNGLQLPKSGTYPLEKGVQVIETVIPPNSSMIGRTLKEVAFRETFDAAVVAIHRNGEKLRGKMGELVLDKGDLLLLSVGSNFKKKIQGRKEIYLVSVLRTIKKTEKRKTWTFGVSTLSVLALCILGVFSLFTALVLIITVAALLGLTNLTHIKQQVSFELLVILSCALAIGNALILSGASDWLGSGIHEVLEPLSAEMVLISLFLSTAVFTAFITNAASVAILFPVAFSLSSTLDVSETAVYLTLAFGASCSFCTPIGYQTNYMVFGPGNYKFRDYLRLGLPLSFVYGIVSLSWIFYRYL